MSSTAFGIIPFSGAVRNSSLLKFFGSEESAGGDEGLELLVGADVSDVSLFEFIAQFVPQYGYGYGQGPLLGTDAFDEVVIITANVNR